MTNAMFWLIVVVIDSDFTFLAYNFIKNLSKMN